MLIGNDIIGPRYVGHPPPWGRTAFASFVAYGSSNTPGSSFVSGGWSAIACTRPWGPAESIRPIGVLLLVVVVLYAFLAPVHRRPLRIGRRSLTLPPPRLLPWQLLVSAFDWSVIRSSGLPRMRERVLSACLGLRLCLLTACSATPAATAESGEPGTGAVAPQTPRWPVRSSTQYIRP
jgi:uncharacterized membrane protein YbhN (UPF0104 family)